MYKKHKRGCNKKNKRKRTIQTAEEKGAMMCQASEYSPVSGGDGASAWLDALAAIIKDVGRDSDSDTTLRCCT
jgi:hypothetical protein